MRLASALNGSRLPWVLSTVGALALAACGGSEEGKGASTAATTQPTPKPSDAAAQPAADQEVRYGMPFEVPLEGEIEYEEPVKSELVATFPEEGDLDSPRPSLANLPSDDAILGRPLVINDVVVPFEEVKKQLCLSTMGATELTDTQIRIFIEEERNRLKEAGAPPERLGISNEEFQKYLDELESNIKTEFPEGEFGMDDWYKSLATEDPRGKVRLQVEFSKLFLPQDPSLFPPLTLEAILKVPAGQAVVDHYQQVWDAREDKSGPVIKVPGDAQFDSAIVQQILSHLLEVASIERDPAIGVLMRVNGVDVLTEDIWKRIRNQVTTAEVLEAKQWIVNTTLLKDALVAAGAWLTDDEAHAAYYAHSDPYRDSMFSIERIALTIKQFPSLEYYTFYRRLYDSFARMKSPTEEELKAQAEQRTNRIVGQVSVDVDVLMTSAFDFKSNSWSEGGWGNAENRMKDVLSLLVDEQRPWEELMDRYSEFYEPPTPASQRSATRPNDNAKGKFRNVQRNGLLPLLGESDYGMFLNGTSVTDFIFFEQEVGTLGQPLRGPYGWYLPRLLRRSKAPKRIPMDEGTLKELVLDDYYTTSLCDFAQELIKKNKVYGLELPGADER